MGLSVTRRGPGCPSRESGWGYRSLTVGVSRVASGLRVPHAVVITPVEPLVVASRREPHFPSGCGLPRYPRRVGADVECFEACSTFTHVAACLLAESPKAARLSEGFDGFVTSTTAPIATGWSDSCRVGIGRSNRRSCPGRLAARSESTRLPRPRSGAPSPWA